MKKKVSILTKTQPKSMVLADGNTYTLNSMNLNMMEEVEEKFDESWDVLCNKLRVKVLKYILYTCMKPNHPELTEETVGELFTSDSLQEASKATLV